jgi:hypothetical protein
VLKEEESAGFYSGNVNVDATTFAVKTDFAVDQCEQGVVVAHSNTGTWMELRPNLTDQDVAGDNGFTAEFLDTTTLRVAVTTVAAAALTLFVCHRSSAF